MSWPPIVIVPSLGADEAGDHAQNGGLAAARWTQEREELAGLDMNGYTVDGPEGAEVGTYVVEIDARAHAVRICPDFKMDHASPDCRIAAENRRIRWNPAVARSACLTPP